MDADKNFYLQGCILTLNSDIKHVMELLDRYDQFRQVYNTDLLELKNNAIDLNYKIKTVLAKEYKK